ncbi:MAG TPA: chemotaxis signal transduction protein CheV [Gammaproteobacteria bacterium]|nr:chemotaxis signal transduction protein CheV [Gammaproteobacteria bacterium]
MAGVLDGVDKRTQLVGENRLELLLFRLATDQLYGINVFKVQEVIRCPPLTHVPNANPVVRGIANMRGKTIPVYDLGMALGYTPMGDISNAFVVIADYNRTLQGYLVNGVDRIVNMNWEEILPPPRGSGNSSYLTAVTRVEQRLVEILDVEKILAEVVGGTSEVSDEIIESGHVGDIPKILVADDSSVARRQITRTLDQLGIESVVVKDGLEALQYLQALSEEHGDLSQELTMVISDVEMPNMDGYTLTTEIRKNPRMKDLYVILHTSLSGVFNQVLVEKVGADKFMPKFDADEFARTILEAIETVKASKAA